MARHTKMFLLTAQVALGVGTLYGCYDSPELPTPVVQPDPPGGGAGSNEGPSGESGRGGTHNANRPGDNPLGGSGGAGGNAGAAGAGGVPNVPSIANTSLPAPCIGLSYNAQLDAIGGAGAPYTWRNLSDLPPGLELADTGALTGTPVAPGTFRVAVEDAAHNSSDAKEFALTPRDTCWLAYVDAEDGGPSRLHFRDVFLDSRTHVALPSAANPEQAVRDFKFSPDASWIAFRAGTPEHGTLWLYSTKLGDAGTLAENAVQVAFTCPSGSATPSCGVLDYAWSDNSRYLAVILSSADPGQDYVSGLDVSAPLQPWPLLSSAAQGAATRALDYYGQLSWVGSEWIAFAGAHIDFPEALSQGLYSAFLAADGRSLEGLGTTTSITGFNPRLRPVPSGLVWSRADETEVTYYTRRRALQDADAESHDGWVSPSGTLIGFVTGTAQLQVANPALQDALSSPTESGSCDEIVAWASRINIDSGPVERVACKAGATIRVFDYTDSPPRMQPLPEIPFAGALTGARRAFSPSGRWLLLGDAGGAPYSLVDVFEGDSDGRLPFASPDEVTFAPGRDAIAFADEQILTEYALPRSLEAQKSFATSGGATAESPCQEVYWENPDHWCGAPAISSHMLYSGDSNTLLFEGPPGSLSLADMSGRTLARRADAILISKGLPACEEGCATKMYAFSR